MGIWNQEMSPGLGQNNRWHRISKSFKTQKFIRGIASNARLIGAEGHYTSIDDKILLNFQNDDNKKQIY